MAGELASAGAMAGTAIMPGIGTAIGGIAGALADSFMSSGNGGPSVASAPMNSTTAVYGSGLDGSGWAINFGSGTQNASSAPTKSNGVGMPTPEGGIGGLGLGGLSLQSIPMWFWIAAAGLVIWKKSASRK